MPEIAAQTDSQRGILTVTCCKCTRRQHFKGGTRFEAITAALRKGWVNSPNGAICPKCPGGGRP